MAKFGRKLKRAFKRVSKTGLVNPLGIGLGGKTFKRRLSKIGKIGAGALSGFATGGIPGALAGGGVTALQQGRKGQGKGKFFGGGLLSSIGTGALSGLAAGGLSKLFSGGAGLPGLPGAQLGGGGGGGGGLLSRVLGGIKGFAGKAGGLLRTGGGGLLNLLKKGGGPQQAEGEDGGGFGGLGGGDLLKLLAGGGLAAGGIFGVRPRDLPNVFEGAGAETEGEVEKLIGREAAERAAARKGLEDVLIGQSGTRARLALQPELTKLQRAGLLSGPGGALDEALARVGQEQALESGRQLAQFDIGTLEGATGLRRAGLERRLGISDAERQRRLQDALLKEEARRQRGEALTGLGGDILSSALT